MRVEPKGQKRGDLPMVLCLDVNIYKDDVIMLIENITF